MYDLSNKLINRVFDTHGNLLGYIYTLNDKKGFISRKDCYYAARNGCIKNVKSGSESDFSLTGVNGFKIRDLPPLSEDEMKSEMSTWNFVDKPFHVVCILKYRLDANTEHRKNVYFNYLKENISWFTDCHRLDRVLGVVLKNISNYPLKIKDKEIKVGDFCFVSLVDLLRNLCFYKNLIEGLTPYLNFNTNKDKINLDIHLSPNLDRYSQEYYLTLYRLQLDTKKVSKNLEALKELKKYNNSVIFECEESAKNMFKEMLNLLEDNSFERYKSVYDSHVISTTAKDTRSILGTLKDKLNIYNWK